MADTVQVVTLIKTELSRRGKGEPNDPVRIVTEYWTMEGEKVTEIDPCPKEPIKQNNRGELYASMTKNFFNEFVQEYLEEHRKTFNEKDLHDLDRGIKEQNGVLSFQKHFNEMYFPG